MLRALIILLFAVTVKIYIGFGQEKDDSKTSHPGISTSMTKKGHANLDLVISTGKFYNKFYTGPNLLTMNQQQSVSISEIAFDYGLISWLNIGIKYQFSFIKQMYKLDQDNFVSKFTTNHLGPEVRLRLINYDNRIEAYLKSSMLFQLDNYLDKNKYTLANSLVVTGRTGYDFLWSVQVEAIVFPSYEHEKKPVTMPVSLFAGYIINSRFIPFAVLNYTTDFGNVAWLEDGKYYRLNYSTSAGVGIKWHFTENMDLALAYLHSISSKFNEPFNSLTLGFDLSF